MKHINNLNTLSLVDSKAIACEQMFDIQRSLESYAELVDIATESLSEMYGFTSKTSEKHSYSTNALTVNHVQTVAALAGVESPFIRSISLEQFELNKDVRVNIALENISDTIQNIWEKLKQFFMRMWEWVRVRVQGVEKAKEVINKKNEELKKNVSEEKKSNESTDQKFRTKSDNGLLVSRLAYDGDDILSGMSGDIKNLGILFRNINTKRKRHSDFLANIISKAGDVTDQENNDLGDILNILNDDIEHIRGGFGSGDEDSSGFSVSVNLIGNMALKTRLFGKIHSSNSATTWDGGKTGKIDIVKGNPDDFGKLPEEIDLAFKEEAVGVIDKIDDLTTTILNLVQSSEFKIKSSRAVKTRSAEATFDKPQNIAKLAASAYLVTNGPWLVSVIQHLNQAAGSLLEFINTSEPI